MPDLAPFHSGKIENFYLLVLGQVQMYQARLYNSIFHIMINYYELTSCIENSEDPDQLASSGASWSGYTLFTREASWSGSTLFTREASWSGSILFARVDIWFYTVFERVNCLSTERYKANLFFRSSKHFYGQVHCGHLLVLGQVEKFTISTPLNKV